MSHEPSQKTIHAWAHLLRAQHRALSHVEQALKEADLPPLCWYDALLELERVGDAGMRPFQLEQNMLLPQYGLSRLLDRIASAGYVKQQPCEIDGRGQIVSITQAGKAIRRRMWPVYAEAVQSAIGANLTDNEAELLSDLLGKLSPKAT